MRYCFYLSIMLLVSSGAMSQEATPSFLEQVKQASEILHCASPEPTDPVAVNAVLFKDKHSDSVAVVVKASIYPGWHIYAYVPSDKPYIVTQQILRTKEGKNIEGEWVKSPPQVLETDHEVFVYEGEATFIHFITGKQKLDSLEAGLSYQTCDIHQCMPPREKTIMLKF